MKFTEKFIFTQNFVFVFLQNITSPNINIVLKYYQHINLTRVIGLRV